MIETALVALDESPLAEAITASRHIYPLLNAAHILGLATLFGSILTLDLRLLGLFSGVPVQPLANVLPRVAGCGLLLAILTGLLLFTVEPLDYVANPAFLAKVAIVAVGTAHALVTRASPAWRTLCKGDGVIGPRLRVSAAFSLAIWTGAIFAGRLIAF